MTKPHVTYDESERAILEKAFPFRSLPDGETEIGLTVDEMIEAIGKLSDDTKNDPAEAAVRKRLYELLNDTEEMNE